MPKEANNNKSINNYFSLLNESDKAFEQVIAYFENYREPTLVLMFGDHQANLGKDFFSKLLDKDYADFTPDDKMKMYETPFIMWANYDIKEKDNLIYSSNFLSSIMLEEVNITSTYYNFIKSFSEVYPVYSPNGLKNLDGNFSLGVSPSDEKLEQMYNSLQYYSENLDFKGELFKVCK